MLSKFSRLTSGISFPQGHGTHLDAPQRLTRNEGVVEPEDSRREPHVRASSISKRDRRQVELVVAAAISDSTFSFLRIAAPVIDLRLAIGALIFAPFLWRSRAQLAAAGWWKIASIDAINTIVPFLLFAWSSERASAMSVPFTALAQ